MAKKDPTIAIREKAGKFSGVDKGSACNQSSFKAGKTAFLFIGPGPKGVGFKAMFKLKASLSQAKTLAKKDPERFQVASSGWVTARFSTEKPLPKTIWEKWLAESFVVSGGGKPVAKKKATKKKTTKKKATKKKVAKKKKTAKKKAKR